MTDLSSTPTIDATQQIDRLSWGVVELQVTDIDRAVAFWTKALGLVVRDHDASGVALGTHAGTLFILHPGATAPVAPPYTGMYHVAIGVARQTEFSRILARLIHLKIRVSPSDHLLAKSLYIADPDGLEIEITFETPERFGRFKLNDREFTIYDTDGNPHSGRGPLDVAAELAHAQDADLMAPIADDSYLAHLHFKVADIGSALDWYETIGFKRHLTLGHWGFADMTAGQPNTHRLAMNIWAGPNRPVAPQDMARLVRYELIAHDASVLDNAPFKRDGKILRGTDPAGIDVTLRAAQG